MNDAKSIPLLRGMYQANEQHKQVEERYPALPQWFSSWDYTAGRRFLSGLGKSADQFNALPVIRWLRQQVKPLVQGLNHFIPDKSVADLKETWNRFAKEQPYYYSNPDSASGRNVDEFELRESGKKDHDALFLSDPLLRQTLGETVDKKMLEIGTGVGRLTEYFSRDFGEVHGVDISSEMLEIAKKRLLGVKNVFLQEIAGNVIPHSDSHFDFIFSSLVFKHLPSRQCIADYFREIRRALKPGGIAKIELRTGSSIYKWRWFHGISLSPEEADALAQKAGLRVVRKEVEDTKNLWVWLTRE
jgi:SAM-dependent methyltransferase